MPRGDKSKYTDKQIRQAEHIEDSYRERGLPEDEAEARAWATVNKIDGGGKKSGSGRGHAVNKEPMKKGGQKGAASTAHLHRNTQPATARSASAKKGAQTRPRKAATK